MLDWLSSVLEHLQNARPHVVENKINMANWVLSVVGIGARSPACSKKHQSILFIWADGGESLARLEFEQRHWKVPRFQSFSLPSSSKPRCQPILENRALWSCTTCGYTRAPMWWDSDKFRLLSQVEGDLIQAWKILRCFAKNNACCMLLDSSVRLGGSKPWLKTWQIDLTLCSFRRDSWCQRASSLGLDVVFGTGEDYLFTFFYFKQNSNQKSPNKVLVP